MENPLAKRLADSKPESVAGGYLHRSVRLSLAEKNTTVEFRGERRQG
jgi:hypothetical protein